MTGTAASAPFRGSGAPTSPALPTRSSPRPDGWPTRGVREVFLVSGNSSSYGNDLGDIRLLEKLLGRLAGIEELDWIRVSYLRPAELRPDLVAVLTGTPKVVPYFDLSFQHASASVLRRMRRFGNPEAFLTLIDSIRQRAPRAGIRSNVIVGFPGETDADVTTLADFLGAARLDAIGVFGYSDETDTEAAGMTGKISEDQIEARRAEIADLADELVVQRAEERIGEPVRVLIESVDEEGLVGRAEHQGPEVDGTVRLLLDDPLFDGLSPAGALVGRLVDAVVQDTDGVDLLARSGPVAAEPR